METQKMKVEIWSDITCPHCYTAKRQFDQALDAFPHKDRVAITWRSFELAPGFKTDPAQRLPDFMARLQGTSPEQTRAMMNDFAASVKVIGLDFQLEQAIPANSFNAHRVSHLAKAYHLQHKAEERLFKAYFTEGKNMDDIPTLVALGIEIGLDETEVCTMLESEQFVDEVQQDLAVAKQTGISSVPHYVFNGQIRLSGAQGKEEYADLLATTFAQWESETMQSQDISGDGQSCKIGDVCH